MKVAVVPAQIVVGPAILTLTGEFALTVIVSVLEVAGFPDAQELEVKIHFTTSVLAKVVLEYVSLLVPTLPPLTFHWYAGGFPPLVGVAVNVLFVPEQIVVLPEMLTLTGVLLIDIGNVFEVAGFPFTQAALDVRIQVTRSPKANVEVEYVVLLVPTLPPFTLH